MTEPVMTYQVLLNMNQLPGSVVERKEEWEECLPNLDGMFGVFLNAKDKSMTVKLAKQFVELFDGKKKVLVMNWPTWKGRGEAGERLSHENFREHHQEKYGYEADEIFIFDDGCKFLSVEQLDELQAAGWPPVMINTRCWGPKADSHEWEEDMKASMAHPHCAGVVVEGNPQVFHKPDLRHNPRLQVAKYVAELGKPLYILVPPCWPANNEHGTHIKMCEKSLACLHEVLDGVTRPGQVFLVPAYYKIEGRDNDMDALPARDENGQPANTFMGSVLLMCERKG